MWPIIVFAILFTIYFLWRLNQFRFQERKIYEDRIHQYPLTEKECVRPDEVILVLGEQDVFFEGKYFAGCDPYNGNSGDDSTFEIWKIYLYIDFNEDGNETKIEIYARLNIFDGNNPKIDFALLQEKLAGHYEDNLQRWSEK